MGAAGELVLRLRVIASAPLPTECGPYANVTLGIQIGQAVQDGSPHADGVAFECECRVRENAATGRPNFLGPAVHGTPDARFLYLAWLHEEAGRREMFRRMKIHLATVTWEQVRAAVESGRVLEARVASVGRDGTPACASVPLLGGGWSVAAARS